MWGDVITWSVRSVCWTQNECFVIKRSRTKWVYSVWSQRHEFCSTLTTHDHKITSTNTSFISAVSPGWWVQMHRGLTKIVLQFLIWFTDSMSCDQLLVSRKSSAIFYVSTSVVVLWSVCDGRFLWQLLCDHVRGFVSNDLCLVTVLCNHHPWWHFISV